MAEDQVQEIKSRIDIVDLVSGYVPLKKAGKNHKGLCPFHQEKTPSFMVSPELQIFKCFGCGRGGDIYAFLQEIEGIEFREALEILAERAGVKLERRRPSPEDDKHREVVKINQAAHEYFGYILNKHPVGEKARAYLKNRGITEKTIETFGLGYAPDSWESLSKFLSAKKQSLTGVLATGLVRLRPKDNAPYDFFRGRIIFPFFGHNNQVIGFAGRTLGAEEPKYINISDTPSFKKSAFLYGLSQAKTTIKRLKSAIVVEGPFDVISPFQAGTQNIVGSQGTALTLDQIKLLKRYTPEISLCFDTDLAGDAAARRGIELAEQRGLNVKAISLPEDFKDADELVRKGAERWKKAVDSAVSVYDFYFLSSFNRHNISDPVGKKQIAAELLPMIKTIPDEIEREHYIQKLAAELEVEVGVVRSALERTESKVQGSKFPVQSSGERDTKAGKERLGLEEYMLALILKSPLDTAQRTLHKLGRHDFGKDAARNLFEELKDYLTGRKRRLDIEVFGAKLEGPEKTLLGEIYLLDLENILETETQLEEELQKTLTVIKRRGLQRKLKTLSREIKEAELTGEKKTLAAAREGFRKVSEQLSRL